MKKIFLVLLLIGLSSSAQVKDTVTVQVDTLVTKKVKSSWYARTMFVSLMSATQPGETLSQRFTNDIEIGKSYGMVDFGLAIGKGKLTNFYTDSTVNTTITTIDNSQYISTNLDSETTSITKTVMYFEARVNMDACQYGIFSNEVSLGIGYMTSKDTPIMLEISSTIFAQLGENWGLGIVYGNYNFTGDNNDLNKSFTGLFLRFGLLRDDGGILLSRTHMRSKKTLHRKNNN